LRRGKQILVDRAKQHIRLQLLAKCGGKPLLDDNTFLAAYEQLLLRIQNSQAPVIVLALPAVDPTIFPGTAELIGRRNTGLRELAARYGADFLEWSPKINNTAGFFCRDGFHPNEWGANAMAKQLLDCLVAKEDVKVVPARHG
jgi:lysophospholipase L1-like esterase